MDANVPPRLPRRARIARTLVVGTAGLGLCAAAVSLGRDQPADVRVTVEPVSAATPLGLELRRCKALEQAALTDAECRRVWVEQRRRFLGLSPAGGERR